MFKFWVKDAALTLVSVFAARWRPTQIVIFAYACSIYNSLILIPFWTHQFVSFFSSVFAVGCPSSGAAWSRSPSTVQRAGWTGSIPKGPCALASHPACPLWP